MESFIKVPTDFGANSALWWAGGMAKPLAIFSDWLMRLHPLLASVNFRLSPGGDDADDKGDSWCPPA